MSHSNASVATLVAENFTLLKDMDISNGVLDLASGNGRNGLFLVEHHIPVIFADNNEAALEAVNVALSELGTQGELGTTWLVDLEAVGEQPLANKQFDGILVFNYLHRPLFSNIRKAVTPGGLVFYETFTEDQRQFGRPTNPDFLLKKQELYEALQDWQVLHYFEGEVTNSSNSTKAVASLIARKPEA